MDNMNNFGSSSRDIQIAKLAFIGASIAAIGDAIAALAAGLAVEALENPIDQRTHRSAKFEMAQRELDGFIHELIQIRNQIG